MQMKAQSNGTRSAVDLAMKKWHKYIILCNIIMERIHFRYYHDLVSLFASTWPVCDNSYGKIGQKVQHVLNSALYFNKMAEPSNVLSWWNVINSQKKVIVWIRIRSTFRVRVSLTLADKPIKATLLMHTSTADNTA